MRQGDPLSFYPLLLCIAILAGANRSDSAIHGAPFDDIHVKQILYANDMSLFVQDIESFNI